MHIHMIYNYGISEDNLKLTSGIRVDESTISQILKTSDKQLTTEVLNPDAKQYRSITVPEVEAKALAREFGVLSEILQFSHSWLQKFKERNSICQIKLQDESASADDEAIINALPLLSSKYTKILPASYNADLRNLSENISQDNGSKINDLSKMLKNINFSDSMQVNKFLTIPEEKIIYTVFKSDKAIEELVEIFKDQYDLEYSELDKIDDSLEISTIIANEVFKSLETVHLYLLQQENTSENLKL
ncbi:10795_t:CDS:2, partial [Dentiscutata erythropus]